MNDDATTRLNRLAGELMRSAHVGIDPRGFRIAAKDVEPIAEAIAAVIASAPAGDGVEDDAALLADANGWYSQAQVDDMERDSRGCLACKCGDYPRPSGNNVMPDDGWRSMWCQGCMEHVVGWCASEVEAIEKWNAQRTAELTTAPAAALARPRAAVGEREAQALLVFAACARDLEGTEYTERTPDDEYAKFRLLASDYRRAYDAYVALTGKLPPFPDEAHAALQSPPAKVEG